MDIHVPEVILMPHVLKQNNNKVSLLYFDLLKSETNVGQD